MQQLIPGANLALTQPQFQIKIKTAMPEQISLDMSAYILNAQAKVRGDADMIFYGQKQTPNRSVELLESTHKTPYLAQFNVNTQLLEAEISKVSFCAAIDGNLTINAVQDIQIELWENGQLSATAMIKSAEKTEKALILAEVYRYKELWKFRFVNQGFNGGLKPLSEYFGVEISDTPPTVQTAPVPPKPEKLSLSKVSLDKQNNKINLTKKDQAFGEIKINLNWNQKTATKQNSFFDKMLNHGKSVDLDLGCLFEMQDGTRSVIQALGDCFGSFHNFPFIELSGDDRTGALQGGEWLRINGKNWDQIHRVVIFAFIYQGVPNWAETDAVVTIYVPEQPPIEIRLIEGQPFGMCGIVELVNQKGNIEVRRHVQYVKGHKELDRAFSFGLRWVAGSK
ncbi:TerD family protein [Acinetobacter sp. TR11]|uniref:TerD family protein n=1 Tax=Acinetobacter sp. TR11 TaxID=3003393 RepID=UPI0022ABD2E1|nr:TerD family protein [Acinetobacter sp. TR11]WAU74886.1 TerD family protein [Acinetobacter sp. TR11]